LKKDQYASGITGEDFEENEIYGGYAGWNNDDTENLWEYIEELKTFLTKAKMENNGVILYIY